MNKKLLTIGGGIGIIAFLLVLGFGCTSTPEVTTTETGEIIVDRDAILFDAKQAGLIMDDEEMGQMSSANVVQGENIGAAANELTLKQDFHGWQGAALADVTGGESFGLAHAQFTEGTYQLIATFGNLPVPGEGYFYEGWLVRRGTNMEVISTGQIEVVGDKYANAFTSYTDYSRYDFYVLTLEPDDGNPSPDEHILEGTFN